MQKLQQNVVRKSIFFLNFNKQITKSYHVWKEYVRIGRYVIIVSIKFYRVRFRSEESKVKKNHENHFVIWDGKQSYKQMQ